MMAIIIGIAKIPSHRRPFTSVVMTLLSGPGACPTRYFPNQASTPAWSQGWYQNSEILPSRKCTTKASLVEKVWPPRRMVPRCRTIPLLVIATFGITNIGDCAYGGHVEHSDHYPDHNGQAHALDVMVGDARTLGDQVAAWFTQHHQALNVKYIIWWGEIIDYRDASPAWGPCKKAGSSCATLHFDHVHVSFWA